MSATFAGFAVGAGQVKFIQILKSAPSKKRWSKILYIRSKWLVKICCMLQNLEVTGAQVQKRFPCASG